MQRVETPESADARGGPMRAITAIESLLSGFPLGTMVSAHATQDEVIASGPAVIPPR